jgi:FlaA1/EpsC-like NDP-sugar epimerase
VLDLARNLIRLSGHTPEDEISIVFTGLRPGEKLFEELAGAGEIIDAGPVDKIQRIVSTMSPLGSIEDDLRELERLAIEDDADGVLLQLSRLVPGFRPTRTFEPA